MKKSLKSQKGITMITLSIAIIILVLISNILIYNGKEVIQSKKLENMYNDVESLRDKVIEYNVQYGDLPLYNNIEYSLEGRDDLKDNWIAQEEKTVGKFYVIDLKALEGVTLNYGRDYEKVTSEMTTKEISELEDIYIVNSISQNVFYVKGIDVKNKKYYSDREKDETVIDVKYEKGNVPLILEAETETTEIKMIQGSEYFGIKLKNYKDKDFNILDVNYEIRLKDTSKFKIEVEDENEGIVKGGKKNENNVTIVLTSVPNVILDIKEQIIVQVVQKEPYEKIIELPIDILLPTLAKGYMNDFRRVKFSDMHDNPDEEYFDKLYGDNRGYFVYDEDGSIILDEDNTVPIFDRSQRNYTNGYSLYITIKGDTNQDTSDPWGIPTIFAMSDDQTGTAGIPNRLCWIGLKRNMLHVYSYYNEQPVKNCDYEYEKPGFISKNISAYSNKIMNIQITGINGGKTNVYINGQLFKSFDSGLGTGSFNQAIIGDLRAGRGIKFIGNFYDIAVYNRVLSSEEIQENWDYARSNWNIN